MKKKTITAKELMTEYGLKKNQAQKIIRHAKKIMVDRGYEVYNNKQLSIVPREVAESILGFGGRQNESY